MTYIGLNATRWAWAAPVASSSERLVLLALAKHADEDGGSFPSADTLAEETCLNRKTVFSVIASLCESGFIVRSCRSGQGRRNQYELLLDSTDFGTSQKRNVPKTVRPSSQKRDIESTENGTSNVPKTVHEYRREERREKRSEERSFIAHACANAPASHDEAPFPDFEDVPSEALFDLEQATTVPEPVKPKPKRARSSKAECSRDAYTGLETVTNEEWSDWTKHRTRRRAVISQGVIDALATEAKKAGMTLGEAMREQVGRGWTGFKAAWIEKERRAANGYQATSTRREILDRGTAAQPQRKKRWKVLPDGSEIWDGWEDEPVNEA